ncbi:MAG TPA: GNAT family N-acetyltransferase [Mobilitalea sp.]|nr:GNAT family N-acetyltransferase [Mobilitalea sp.]
MDIRKALIEDVGELVKIRLAYLEEDFELTEEQNSAIRAQLPEYFVNHIGKDLNAYVAIDNKEIVSSVFLLIIEKPANPHFITGKTGTILNVYTKPEYRRRGLAGQLLRMAMEDAKAMQLSYLELNATDQGYPLYKKLGFEEAKQRCVTMKYIL